jgi:uncharacterized protein (DUF488 family)
MCKRHIGDYLAFFAAMETQPAALDTALALLAQHSRALLCFEADPATCHRRTVADALVARAGGTLRVVDLVG